MSHTSAPIAPHPSSVSTVSPVKGPLVTPQDRDMAASFGDAAAYGAMVGVGESYLPAFVLAVGLSEFTAGLVASLPLLGGGLMQLVSPRAVGWLASHKKWVLICGLAQALSFVPLALAAWAGRISAPIVLLVATLYWGAGLATGPAWNAWIGALIPRVARARFFARRTLLNQAMVLCSLLGGGAVLHISSRYGHATFGFAALFLIAALFRLTSVGFLSLQSEPASLSTSTPLSSLGTTWKRLQGTPGGNLLLYLVAAQWAVQIAGPYYAPYMLKTLRFSYAEFVGLIMAAYLAKIVALHRLGHLAHHVGALRLLRWSAWGIAPLAAAWCVSDHYAWLFLVQIVGGLLWATYELAFFLLFLESFREEERTSVLTLYNLFNNVALVAGAAVGGTILYLVGVNHSTFMILFVISSVGRGLALLLLNLSPHLEVETEAIAFRTIGVRPMSANLDSPILPSLPDQVANP